jgi:hypothetical protein
MGFFDLHEPENGQDQFFLYAMIILPLLSSTAYLFDSWYHYQNPSPDRTYEGLLSTIVIVFSFLQYCAPIRSRKLLAIYFILLFIITEIGTMGYLLHYIHEKDVLKIFFYSCLLIIAVLFTSGLIYCRVINEYESHIVVENKHLFHFMSRLEVILTIFIPVYMNISYTSLTRNVIAYFLLFDFFSDSYSRFQGVWIKGSLYLFATTTTISVATEWFYFNHHRFIYEEISLISELVATIFCDTIIILQFFPFHFKTQYVQNIAREALLFQQTLYATNVQTNLAISQAMDAPEINDDSSKRGENSRRATLEEPNIDMKTMI